MTTMLTPSDDDPESEAEGMDMQQHHLGGEVEERRERGDRSRLAPEQTAWAGDDEAAGPS
jgi:hypothetical protein